MMAKPHLVPWLKDDLLTLHPGNPGNLALADAVILGQRIG
jgi:hypothetical protein